MRDEVADGWKISQVEVLVGLPRRDIQRACYEGAGGLGIVKPRNTTWGWRVYEVPDVAKLFLLAQGRRQGKTLDEVRDELASCEGARDVSHKLARCEQAAREAYDAQAGASMSACALRCAIEQGDVTVFAGLIDASFAEDARAFCDAHAALGLAAEGLLSKLFADLARVCACGQAPGSNEAKEILRSFSACGFRAVCVARYRCGRAACSGDECVGHGTYVRVVAWSCDMDVCECSA